MISQKEHVSTLQGCPTRQSKKASSTDWSLWSRWDLETAVGSRSHCGARPPYHYEQEHSMNIRNFANLTMWGLVALSLVVSTVGTVAELEPLEQNCLLQTKESKEQQLVVHGANSRSLDSSSWHLAMSSIVEGIANATGPSFQLSLENCENRCSGSPGFNMI